MKREYVIVDSSINYGSTLNRHICVDTKKLAEVSEVFRVFKERLLLIQERILTVPNMYYDNYKREGFNEKTKNVTAIKILDFNNTRFYCQEKISKDGTFMIICGAVFNKKSEKNNKKNKPIIETIASYNYEEKHTSK